MGRRSDLVNGFACAKNIFFAGNDCITMQTVLHSRFQENIEAEQGGFKGINGGKEFDVIGCLKVNFLLHDTRYQLRNHSDLANSRNNRISGEMPPVYRVVWQEFHYDPV